MGVKAAEWEASNVDSSNNSVYERSTIFDSEPQNNTNSRDNNHEHSHKQRILNQNQSLKKVDNNQSNIKEILHNNKQSPAAPRNIDEMFREVFMIENPEIPATVNLPELEVKNSEFPKANNVTFIQKNVSPFFSINGENSQNNINFNLTSKNVDESLKSDREAKVLTELDDTELINTECVNRITENNSNKTKYSHRFDNSIGGNLQEPREKCDNFSDSSKFSIFDILEVEKRFHQEEGDNKIHKEVNSSKNQEFKEHSVIHRITDAMIPSFSYSPKPRFQSPVQNVKDIIRINYSKSNDQAIPHIINANCSTPVSNHSHDGGNLSSNDMFSESPLMHSSTIRQGINTLKNQTLEEFDINWGGDSLLEFSQIETKNFENNPKENTLKRKLSDTAEELNYSKKKICLLQEKEKLNYSKKIIIPEIKERCIVKESVSKSYFQDSMPFNSHLENFISENEKITKPSSSQNKFEKNKSELSFKLESPNIDYLKLKHRPKSEGNISSKTLIEMKDKNLRETSITNAFNATFKYKLSEMLNDSLKEELNINDINSDDNNFDKLNLSISDSEDFITG